MRLGYYSISVIRPRSVMNTFKTALISMAALCGIASAVAADARGGFHHRGGVGVGVFIGAPLYPYYYPRYYYPPAYYPPAYYPGPYAYYPPAVAAPAAPPVYIEQAPPTAGSPSAPSQAAGSYWYYCRDSQAYYPYVQQCASPWQQVAPQPGPPGPQSAPAVPQSGPYDPQAGAPYGPPTSDDPESTPRT
ncbi:MAG: hypothetical protein QOK44_464 [Betaproteobacteria bacterium]|nr:hypothetical protein [Betaproteobacteria bacterium]